MRLATIIDIGVTGVTFQQPSGEDEGLTWHIPKSILAIGASGRVRCCFKTHPGPDGKCWKVEFEGVPSDELKDHEVYLALRSELAAREAH